MNGGADEASHLLQEANASLALDPMSPIVSLGSHVVLEDIDDRTREEYVLVSVAESSPSEGRLSNESPVGSAIVGHRRGDVVDARAPRGVRHLRIADLRTGTGTP